MTQEFKPTEATKAKLAGMKKPMSTESVDEFFALWESEGDDAAAARRAGSIMAHRFLVAAAQFAVFGAACSGQEPSRDLWLEACNKNFDDAVDDVNTAFVKVEEEEADGPRADSPE
jgi:hypothetical protein